MTAAITIASPQILEEQITELAASDSQSSGGDRYTLHVHTDITTLKKNGDGAEGELEDGGNVSAETSRRLPLPGLHGAPPRGRAPHQALGRRRGDEAG